MEYENGSPWNQNFLVYSENISTYYIISIVISFLSVIFTWWYHKSTLRLPSDNHTECVNPEQENDNDNIEKKTSREECEIMNHLKITRQSAIVQQVAAGLTEEQLREEKETEAQQLAAIYQLLREQEDKFQVNSMEELEDQMKLYRAENNMY